MAPRFGSDVRFGSITEAKTQLEEVRSLARMGPTLTNVNDFRAVLIEKA